MQVKVKQLIRGWCGVVPNDDRNYTFLALVVFNLPDDPKLLTGFALLHRRTGELMMPLYFRVSPQPSGSVLASDGNIPNENLQMPDWVHAQVEIAARKFASPYLPKS